MNSALNTLADPSAAVVITGIVSYVTHKLASLKIGNSTLGQDIAKEWPAVKQATDQAAAIAQSFPEVRAELSKAQTDIAAVSTKIDSATGGVAEQVAQEVQKQFGTFLTALAHGQTLAK